MESAAESWPRVCSTWAASARIVTGETWKNKNENAVSNYESKAIALFVIDKKKKKKTFVY